VLALLVARTDGEAMMEMSIGDTAEQGLPLSAAEIETLLMHPHIGKDWCLKLLLLELVMCRALEIVPAKRRILGLASGDVQLLVLGSRKDQPLAPPLRHVVNHCAYDSMPHQGHGPSGVPLSKLAYDLYDYYQPDMRGSLAERGLLFRESHGRFRFFRGARWELTEAGKTARADLGGRVSLARQKYVSWREHTVGGRAAVPVEKAGGLLLVMVHPHPAIVGRSQSHQAWLERGDTDPVSSEMEYLSALEFEDLFGVIDDAVERAAWKWVNNA
jgi:hypothetical protein